MCYACLSTLNSILSEGEIAKLKEFFIGLTPNTKSLITVSKIANFLEIDTQTATEVILQCEKEGILKRRFGLRCPNCGALIREISTPSVEGIILNECYSCDAPIEISDDDVVVLFELVKVEIPFENGQQGKQCIELEASVVAQEDTLKAFQIMCDSIKDRLDKDRLDSYRQKYKEKRKAQRHKKAVKQAERNRKIKIVCNILSIFIVIIVICLVYMKFGFSKLSLFTGFAGFIVPFIGNHILG